MNAIDTAIYEAPSWSSQPCWRAYAIINGRRTTMTCGHSHSRQDLAQRCAGKAFMQYLAPIPNAELVELHDGLMEARWHDSENRPTARRFRYLPTR